MEAFIDISLILLGIVLIIEIVVFILQGLFDERTNK